MTDILDNELAAHGNADPKGVAVALKRLANFANWTEAALLAVIFGAAIGAAICIYLWWPEKDHSSGLWFGGVAFLTIMFTALVALQTIWRLLSRGTILGWRPRVLNAPDLAPALAVVERCADGSIKVETHLGERIDRSFFRNALAPLLLSDLAEHRTLVRSVVRRKAYEAQLFAASVPSLGGHDNAQAAQPTVAATTPRTIAMPTAADIGLGLVPTDRLGLDEPPLRNENPVIQWLVGGTRDQFGLGLDRYLDTLAPSKVAWHRVVLEVGRRELRKGGGRGAQADAVRQIIAALRAAGLKYPDVDKGDATSSIKQLLAGQPGKKDITGHFQRETREIPQDSSKRSDKNG